MAKAVTYLEADLPRCVLDHGVAPCGAVLGFLGIAGELAGVFDGTNDYLRRAGGLTGAADSKTFTLHLWYRPTTVAGNPRLLVASTALAGATERFRIRQVGDTLDIAAWNAAGAVILNVATPAGSLVAGKLYHVAVSFDMSDPARRHVYLNRVKQNLVVTTYIDDTIDFTLADWSVGAVPDGTNKFTGQLGEVWFSPGTYVDLSRTENLERFVSTGGNPVNLGPSGAAPTGASPLVFLSSATPDTSFGTNKGTGGNFTLTGALTAFVATGVQKCFRSPTTCQDLGAFSTGKMQVFETLQQNFPTETTSHAVAMSSSVVAGDLLLVLFAAVQNPTITTPTGWTQKTNVSSGTAIRYGVYARVANGTEGGTTVDFVTGTARRAVAIVYRVRKQEWGGTTVTDVEASATNTGATSTPAVNAITPSWGANANNLFLATVALGDYSSVFPSAYPLLFSNFRHVPEHSAGANVNRFGLASSVRISNLATLTPGSYTLTGTPGGSVTAIIVVRGAVVTPTTVRFSTQAEYNPRGIDALAAIVAEDFSPQIIGLGTGLGERSALQVVLGEAPHSDAGDGYDPYRSERWYSPYELGTHWAKFRARWFGLQGVPCRLYRGFSTDNLGGMEERRLFLESASGPSHEGVFQVTAKDALKFLDGDRAQAPTPSTGRLNASIDAADLTVTLVPSGIGPTYRSQGYVALGGSEIAAYTRQGDVLTFTARGALGTAAGSHTTDDRVQQVLRYEAQNVANIIADLEINYGGVPAELVPISDWVSETSSYLNTVYTGTVGEPTSVKQLVGELCVQAGLMHWQDELSGLMKLQVIRSIAIDASVLDEGVYAAKSFSIQEQPGKRVSRALTFFGVIDPLRPLDEIANYRNAALTIDADAELRYGSGVPAIAKVFSRWIDAGGLTVAQKLNDLLLERLGMPPRKFTLDVLRGGSVQPSLAGAHFVMARLLQNEFGEQVRVPAQVTSIRSDAHRLSVVAEEQRTESGSGILPHTVVIGSNQNNLNLRDAHDALFIQAVSGDTVTLIIQSGVVVGSSVTGDPAVDIGSWPAGVAVVVRVSGKIEGKGGKGGRGGGVGMVAQGGNPGGVALFTRQAINLYVSTGALWGGGGGGGGGSSAEGGGGGGGAGVLGGDGGSPGAGSGGTSGKDGDEFDGGAGGNATNKGGKGGDPGQAGASGTGPFPGVGGAGGAPVDGWSFVTVVEGPGDVQGPTIN